MLIALIYVSKFSLAQNVGVGTTNPKAKLELKDTSKTRLMISSKNYVDTAQIILSNRNSINEGTDFLITARREQGIYITTDSDLNEYKNDSLLTIQRTGNTGIGTKNPT